MSTISQTNLDMWWSLARPRDKKDYGYGGDWLQYDVDASTDCSGIVCYLCAALTLGPQGWRWPRWPFSTEDWRVLNYGEKGPFGTISVALPTDVPADAAVKIGLHHGGGGPNSHMACTLMDPAGQINIESSGDYGQRMGGPARGLYLPDGVTVWNYWDDFAYLPGQIESEDWAPVLNELLGIS